MGRVVDVGVEQEERGRRSFGSDREGGGRRDGRHVDGQEAEEIRRRWAGKEVRPTGEALGQRQEPSAGIDEILDVGGPGDERVQFRARQQAAEGRGDRDRGVAGEVRRRELGGVGAVVVRPERQPERAEAKLADAMAARWRDAGLDPEEPGRGTVVERASGDEAKAGAEQIPRALRVHGVEVGIVAGEKDGTGR